MMRTSIRLGAATLALASLAVASLPAQDALQATPEAYRLGFENDWVKVVRVHYAPRVVLAPHDHTALPAAYVYLNDGGPILFKHVDLPYGAVTRPATKAGSFRVYRGLKEVHSVENPSDTPSEFLRVEFKTEPVDEGSLRGKFFRDDTSPAATVQRIQFENAQVRVSRLLVAPGESLEVAPTAGHPTLLVALIAARVEMNGAGEPSAPLRVQVGDARWVDPSRRAHIRGEGDRPAELLRFDLKTKPVGGATRRVQR